MLHRMTIRQKLLHKPSKSLIALCLAINCHASPIAIARARHPPLVDAAEAAGRLDGDVAAVRVRAEDGRVPDAAVPELLGDEHQRVFAVVDGGVVGDVHAFGPGWRGLVVLAVRI